ncbi:hypothetical protein ABT040_30155 [Streptomyces sp. NPDC002688]|uniref:hypothetical protein n=1 Tax=Streptomyces sp. NPDC002688 TaxID=3154423 RepID=UPI00331EEB51
MNSRELNAAVAQYEQAVRSRLPLFDGLSAAQLDELEDLSDSDAPAALVAERLGTLAIWQQQLGDLEAAAADDTEVRSGMEAQRQLWRALYARTTAAFTGWYFGGWSALPQNDTAEETNR